MALRWDSAVTQRFDWPEYNEGNRHQFKKYHRAGERHSSQGHCQSNGPAISAGLKCQILTTSSMVKLPEGAVEHKMRSYASHPEHSDGRLWRIAADNRLPENPPSASAVRGIAAIRDRVMFGNSRAQG